MASDQHRVRRSLPVRSLAIALLSTACALALRFLIDPWARDQMPYETFIVAVAITGLYAGVAPAGLAIVLGAIIGNYFFVQPRLQLVAFATREDWAAFIGYLVASVLIVILTRARTKVFMRAEGLLHELQAVIQASPLGIISLSLERKVGAWNAAARQILGWSADEIIGAPLPLPASATGRWAELSTRILAGEIFVNVESKLLTKNGTQIDALVSGSPVRDASGKIVAFIAMVGDATELNRAKNALIEAERLAAAGRLASTVAHEVNNPLEAAINLIFLARAEEDQRQAQAYLQKAEHELSRASALTRKTLVFLQESLSPEAVRVDDLLDEALSLYERPLADRNIQIRRRFRPNCELITYPHELRRVILNLFVNAMDALVHGGVLVLSVRPADHPATGKRGVRITIADTGIGIPADSHRKIFRPFFTTKPATGAGLGLWVTKSIVERMGGSIRLRSSTGAARHGTAFSVFLPAKAAAPASQTQASAAVASPHAGVRSSDIGDGRVQRTA